MKQEIKDHPIFTALAVSAILAAGNFFLSTKVSEATTEVKFHSVNDKLNDLKDRMVRIENKLDNIE